MSELKTNKISTNDGNNVAIDTALGLKSYDTTGRDALTSVAGDTIYNETTQKVEFYNGSAWIQGGGVDVASIEYLLIAGGGGGGNGNQQAGGGGGAGGFITNYASDPSGGNSSTTAGLYLQKDFDLTISVGAGGGGDATNYGGAYGNDSILGPLTAQGGGRGAGRSSGSGVGGSGGGGHGGTADSNGRGGGGNPITGQGMQGGGGNYSNARAGGGGGAGMKGYYNTTDGGRPGGDGLVSTILTTAQATTYSVGEVIGSDVWFAGGGGSSPNDPNTTIGVGGKGGGGNSTHNSVPTAAGINTGGGGGGRALLPGAAGAGASGVIIIRFPDTLSISGLTGLTSSTFTSGGYKYYIFTGGESTTVQFS